MPEHAQRRRPRPAADAPVGDLLDGVVVAKGWLIELMFAAPLSLAGEVPVAELAEHGPALGGALIAAVLSDEALEELAELGAAAAALSGAEGPARLAVAIEALRAAAGAALRAEIGPNDPDLGAAVADRLAHACSVLLESALHAPQSRRTAAGVPDDSAPVDAIDQRPFARRPRAVPDAPRGRTGDPTWWPGDGTPIPPGEEPWRAMLALRLKRHAKDHLAFAVLAIEVDDADRLLETGEDAAEAITQAERAIAGVVRPADMLVRERAGRYWLAAPETDATAARALGESIAASVVGEAVHHGEPLTVSIGVAVCPHDGIDADALAAHADERVFAARAAGVRLA